MLQIVAESAKVKRPLHDRVSNPTVCDNCLVLKYTCKKFTNYYILCKDGVSTVGNLKRAGSGLVIPFIDRFDAARAFQ